MKASYFEVDLGMKAPSSLWVVKLSSDLQKISAIQIILLGLQRKNF